MPDPSGRSVRRHNVLSVGARRFLRKRQRRKGRVSMTGNGKAEKSGGETAFSLSFRGARLRFCVRRSRFRGRHPWFRRGWPALSFFVEYGYIRLQRIALRPYPGLGRRHFRFSPNICIFVHRTVGRRRCGGPVCRSLCAGRLRNGKRCAKSGGGQRRGRGPEDGGRPVRQPGSAARSGGLVRQPG